ncbi:uncharacterized protein LOC117121723 [Anneissia japonica]|uniref:uncharacterized protein LOC117121723 n=1 Tax=Anneissia japonica TaxID=1529436 RepID=UPI0014254C08|nr:uncharacterized protein LOC117121723 [Anneissia japonica]
MIQWFNETDKGKEVRVLLLDYKKAFDLIHNNLIIQKLRDLNADEILVNWIRSFLSNPLQQVKMGKHLSSWLSPNGSVPKGSWLGPVLSLIFINSLKINLPLVKYMDDTTASETISSLNCSNMQIACNDIYEWSCINSMVINEKKTVEMLISGKRFKSNLPALIISNVEIEKVDQTKLLGFGKVILTICKKCKTRIY